MSIFIVNATIGASMAVAIGLVSRSSFSYLTGLLPLFPTFALIANFQAFSTGGASSVKLVAAFGLMSLIAYASYLLSLLLLIDRMGFRSALICAIVIWTLMATLITTAWRCWNLKELIT